MPVTTQALHSVLSVSICVKTYERLRLIIHLDLPCNNIKKKFLLDFSSHSHAPSTSHRKSESILCKFMASRQILSFRWLLHPPMSGSICCIQIPLVSMERTSGKGRSIMTSRDQRIRVRGIVQKLCNARRARGVVHAFWYSNKCALRKGGCQKIWQICLT